MRAPHHTSPDSWDAGPGWFFRVLTPGTVTLHVRVHSDSGDTTLDAQQTFTAAPIARIDVSVKPDDTSVVATAPLTQGELVDVRVTLRDATGAELRGYVDLTQPFAALDPRTANEQQNYGDFPVSNGDAYVRGALPSAGDITFTARCGASVGSTKVTVQPL